MSSQRLNSDWMAPTEFLEPTKLHSHGESLWMMASNAQTNIQAHDVVTLRRHKGGKEREKMDGK